MKQKFVHAWNRRVVSKLYNISKFKSYNPKARSKKLIKHEIIIIFPFKQNNLVHKFKYIAKSKNWKP